MTARLALWIPAFLGVALRGYYLRFPDGSLGHDYQHAFVRFLIGRDFFWKNGLALPHYTAALCGGEPFFADPQSTYLSLPQFLAFFLDPLVSALLAATVFAVLGYVGFWRLVREVLGANDYIAHFSALTFLFNGFSFNHLLVGHLTHHTYFLAPWILLLLCRRYTLFSRAWWRAGALLSLMGSYTVYSGGLHVAVVFSMMLAVSLPWLLFRQKDQKALPAFLALVGMAAVWAILSAAGKIYAGQSYWPTFFIRDVDAHPLSILQALEFYFWFTPSQTPQFLQFGKWGFGAWEYVGFVTRLTIPALLFLLWRGKKRWGLWLPTLILVVAVVLLALGRLHNSYIPFFRGYHNPAKLLGGFLPLMLLILAWALTQIPRPSRLTAKSCFFLGALLLGAEFSHNARFFLTLPQTGGFHWDGQSFSSSLPPTRRIGNREDIDSLRLGESSLKCYEPLFGYQLESWKGEVLEGSTDEVADGRYNLTHPGCLIYPEHFACKPWERISETEAEAFQSLITGRAPPWSLPRIQSFLYWLSAMLALAALGVSLYPGIIRK